MTRIVSLVRSAAVTAGLVALVAGSAGAQQPAGNWQGWLGCWTTGPAIGGIAPSAVAPLVCISPTADASVVQLTTIDGDKAVSTQRIDASGRELPIDAKGCTGTQGAQWSADGRRVYLQAVTACGGVERVTSGIIAMSPQGEWLDVQGVAAGGEEAVRVARYHDAGVPSAVPEEIATALRERGTATQSARFAAGATIGSAAVIEASRTATPAVVEAWLLERGQIFALDGRELVRLADAGVPARVTDAMVAVSNPEKFAVDRPDESARNRRDTSSDVAGRTIYVYMDPAYSPYRWGYSPYGNGYGYGPYGYSPLGYGRYGYGSGYYGGYVPPIVIVTPGQPVAKGRMVKGRGYTQTEPGSATPRPANPRGAQSSSGSSSSESTSSQPARTETPRSEPTRREPTRSEPARSEPARSEPAPRTAHPKP